MKTVLLCEVCGVAIITRTEPCASCGYVYVAQRSFLPMPADSPVDELPPGFLLHKRYRIQQKIGQGGFGQVYKAWDEQKARLVAVKQITLAALSAQEMIEATDSYNREITFLPKLHHKSIPEIYHQFTDPGHWYIVMQYIDGQTLEEILAQAPGGRLPVDEVLGIGAALCDVLGYLHLQDPSIVFRDVKPANIMRSSRGRVYLIDFGIARRYREGQRRDTRPLGSPGYAAPEQYGKAQSTPLTDMYGLGATLQTLLIGKEPDEIQAHGIPTNCDIPYEVQEFLSQMLAPDPKQRPAFMWRVKKDLLKLQKKYPVPTPFSWWFFGTCAFIMSLDSLFVPTDPPGLYLLMLPFCAIVIMGYYLFRSRRTYKKSGFTRRDVRLLIEKSLEKALRFVAFLWIRNIVGWLISALPPAHSNRVLPLTVYIIGSLACIILMDVAWRWLAKRMHPEQSTPVQPQGIVMPPIEQKTH